MPNSRCTLSPCEAFLEGQAEEILVGCLQDTIIFFATAPKLKATIKQSLVLFPVSLKQLSPHAPQRFSKCLNVEVKGCNPETCICGGKPLVPSLWFSLPSPFLQWGLLPIDPSFIPPSLPPSPSLMANTNTWLSLSQATGMKFLQF